MANENRASLMFQGAVIILGGLLWLGTTINFLLKYMLPEQLVIFLLVPMVVAVGIFPVTIPLPFNLGISKRESYSFSLSDALIFLIACAYGVMPAIFIAGIEGFTTSRYTVQRLSSNFFSFGMMTLAATAATTTIQLVLRYGFNDQGVWPSHNFLAVSVALLVASAVHFVVNTGLLSTLIALRHERPILDSWVANHSWAVPMFLPVGAAASLMYAAFLHHVLVTIVVGAPILIAIYFAHRQYSHYAQERIRVVEQAHRETVEALAIAINAKDEVTHEHVQRVQIYSSGVARLLGCTESEIEALRDGALLHDIGKLAVPDYILNKPGKLTAEEFEKMKIHTVVGAQILNRVRFSYPVVPLVRHHHERWDGCGYPDGLKGEEIPLTARILSVVDCFDAVREDRPYRRGMTREEAIDFIFRGSGTLYDPLVVGTFITHLPEFEAEIQAMRRPAVMDTYGIEPFEQLSEQARNVPPAAGLAEAAESPAKRSINLTREELAGFYELAQALRRSHLDCDQLVAAFAEGLPALVPYDMCVVTIVEPQTGERRVAHAAGEQSTLLIGRRITPGEGVTGWVLANRKPFCNTDPKLDFPPQLADRLPSFRTLAVFPVEKGEAMYGAVSLYSSALDRYSETHQNLLSEVVLLFAEALSGIPQTPQPELRHVVDDEETGARDSPQSPSTTTAEAEFQSDLSH